MSTRFCILLTCAAMSSLPGPSRSAQGETIEFVALHDIDNVELRVDGMRRNAFLIGLAPPDQAKLDDAERKRRLEAAKRLASRCDLFVKIVVREEDRIGITLDAYAHHRHGFDHRWNPARYPWCETNWGAYNLNLYFLHRRWADFEDNFASDKRPKWRSLFEKVLEK